MIVLDPRSATPPFEQVRVQIIADIRSSALAAGSRLPTVRRLAADLGLSANTVARAYRELEADGFVQTSGRRGTFVSRPDESAITVMQEAARAYAERADALGLSREQAIRVVTAAVSARVASA